MSAPIVLSVDGRPGLDLADGREAHLIRPGADTAVATIGYGGNGATGANAPPANPGQPAGVLAVELSESQIRRGGIRVAVVGQQSSTGVPPETEIPPQGNVLLSAKGGDGEPGRQGGDGQTGFPGRAGTRATEHLEATDGSPGGQGGNAGSGSNGGNGGQGGIIELRVDEDYAHLLLAASWDVSGGHGGLPGRHGEPGNGGEGGVGGAAHVWEDRASYKYTCTSNCVGKKVTTLEARPNTTINMMLNAQATQMQLQGSVVQTAVARAAQLYRGNNAVAAGDGACRCQGGPQECPGCLATPVYKTFSKSKGNDGRRGDVGEVAQIPLVQGAAGVEGRGVIVVTHRDGHRERYDKRFDLHLQDYDLEDEGGDGIFEPGEHIFLRRITVKNSGGMPSPSVQIPCTFADSTVLQRLQEEEGRTPLPTSIPAGHTATSGNSAKALIPMPNIDPRSRSPYVANQSISLQAIVPWLDRQLESFTLAKSVTLQYPLELHDVRNLDSVANGTTTEISWQVRNKSNIEFGSASLPARQAKVRVTMSAEDGSLRSSTKTGWLPSVDIAVPPIKAGNTVSVKQTLRIALRARAYKRIKITLALYISPASLGPVANNLEISDMQLIETLDAEMQIAPGHIHDGTSDILVVTNADTRKDQFDALQSFIEQKLFLKMAVWNLSLYGRLFSKGSEEADQSENVFLLYQRKIIIFLANSFAFHGDQLTSALRFCDIESLSEACRHGTSCLFLASSNNRVAFEKLVLGVPPRVSTALERLPDSSRYANVAQLVGAVKEEDRVSAIPIYSLDAPHVRYLRRSWNLSLFTKRTIKALHSNFPQERFWVCSVEAANPLEAEIDGHVLIHRGLPHHTPISATETGLFSEPHGQSVLLPGPAGTRVAAARSQQEQNLNLYDQYAIVGALTLYQRIDLLWSAADSQPRRVISEDIIKLIICSTQETLLSEIRSFLSRAPWPNRIDLQHEQERSIQSHLPGVQAILEHPNAKDGAKDGGHVPEEIFHLLYFVLAACQPQKRRHFVKQTLLPFGHRRRQLRQVLTNRFIAMLKLKGLSEEDLQSFSKNAASLHSNFDSKKRDTLVVLGQDISTATGKSRHYLSQARLGTSDVYPRTRRWTEAEWDARFEAAESHRKNLEEMMQRAYDERYVLELKGSVPY